MTLLSFSLYPLAFLSLSPWALVILALLCIITLAIALFLAALIWAAKGSPEVNGDPERDSGLSDLEIERNAAIAAKRAELDRKYRITARRRPRVTQGGTSGQCVSHRGFWLKGTSCTTNQSQTLSQS